MTREAYLNAVAACPGHQILDRLGDKWVSLVLKELGGGPRRSGELNRALPGASRKMLTQTLRGLERDGLVVRTTTGGAPSKVEYRLTPLGASLHGVMLEVVGWAENHIAEVDAARSAYDGNC
ncbi:winged helix-turn-helix transcriptional regulator [Cryptosporangium aurantiacum]|uniref:Transcriptional regulator, HxlR family n=1 Tax=Cryptosporangium aurantiacum TaxID=134849 RepID=A0A1M7N3X7_9ACTN|nr:helix-turn-helix domain-containing protein [Cryptosporangium aurantiacum]SHM98152.1 transcriptional regulator, HxlR family [Cryptosporangium aurantiacum]